MNPEHDRRRREVIAAAWCDQEFKERLIAQPREVLAERGIGLPEGVEVEVVENTPSKIYLVLPQKPDETRLSDQQLDDIAGGKVVAIGSRPGIGFVASLW